MTPWTQTFWVVVCSLLYLFVDALQDHSNKIYGSKGHTQNALVRSIAVGSIILLAFLPLFTRENIGLWTLMVLTMTTWMIVLGWTAFDLMYNLLAKKHPFKYIGSGTIDQQFREEYDKRAWKVMLYWKIIGLSLGLGAHSAAMFLYQRNL